MKTKLISVPASWQKLTYHPLSELVEFGDGIDLGALAQHMSDHGYDQDESIVLLGDKILDGRHKHGGAIKAEVTPTFKEFTGSDAEAVAYVTKKILGQHLDTSQRAMIAAKLTQLRQGGDRRSEDFKAQYCALKTTSQAAEMLNMSERA